MNDYEAFLELSEILGLFLVHPKCLDEFAELIKKDLKGKEAAFFRLLRVQLGYIVEFRHDINRVDSHERLKHSGTSLYSIHLRQSQFNIRLIIAFAPDNTPALLTTFFERSGKRKTDYSERIQLADARFKEIMKGR
jgi:hypothetical protein